MTLQRNRTLSRHLGAAKPYTDVQWSNIKNHLAKAGVPETKLSDRLRKELDAVAYRFARRSQTKYTWKVRKHSSPKEHAADLRKQIDELEATIRVLNEYATSYS